jgi:drug/metabolite transporter (DMT)-like permease
VFVALASPALLGERVRASLAFGLVLGFSGIAVVAQPSFSAAGSVVAAGVATAMASATAMIWLRRIGPSESSEAVVLHFSCVGFVVSGLASIPVWRSPSLRDAVLLGVTGISAGLAQIAMTRAYSLDRAARVSAMGYSGVVMTRALAAPIFGEIPTIAQGLGSLLVVASGVVLALGDAEERADIGERSR